MVWLVRLGWSWYGSEKLRDTLPSWGSKRSPLCASGSGGAFLFLEVKQYVMGGSSKDQEFEASPGLDSEFEPHEITSPKEKAAGGQE